MEGKLLPIKAFSLDVYKGSNDIFKVKVLLFSYLCCVIQCKI